MDFPKSVPNIGLVNGKFVDENTGTGQPGSLIPAVWGNSVTEEILNVLHAADVIPDELKLNQLSAAISAIASKVVDRDAMPVGAGGLMTVAPTVDGKVADLPGSQFFFTGDNTTDTPPGFTYSVGLHIKGPDNSSVDLFSSLVSEEYVIRRNYPTNPTPARRLWHDGNFDPSDKADKATTLAGYGITDGVEKAESGLSAVGKVIEGKVSDLTVTQFFTLGDETTDKPAALTYGAGLHMKYPGDKYGIDIAGGISAEWFGFRKLSAAGLGVWRAFWHDGNFNPSDKADKATTYTKTQVTDLLAALMADPWAVQPIGVPIPIWRHLGDETIPPRDKAYRYIKLTASDAYNAGVLSSEMVSGAEPLLLATAVISLAGSPLNGRTVSLINTERRVLRGAETSGELLFDAVQGHAHMQAVGEDGVNGNTPNTSNTFDGGLTSGNVGIRRTTGPVLNAVTIRGAITDGASGALRSGGETRAKSISATYYLRIK